VIFAAALAWSVKIQEISEMVIGRVKPQNEIRGEPKLLVEAVSPGRWRGRARCYRSASQGSWEAKDIQSHEAARRSREPKCREYVASTGECLKGMRLIAVVMDAQTAAT
jgi:hypothetical protein